MGEENLHINLLVPEPSVHSLPHHVSAELLQLPDQLNHHHQLLLLGAAAEQELKQLCRHTPSLVEAVQTEQLGAADSWKLSSTNSISSMVGRWVSKPENMATSSVL